MPLSLGLRNQCAISMLLLWTRLEDQLCSRDVLVINDSTIGDGLVKSQVLKSC